ncbi:MAG: Thymidine kinase [Calditrichaeota bacterium]|nr:Thymidine kinase [Calditrichota bacterium]
MLNVVPKGSGWVEVICGCMFSGKTEELIRRLRRARIARQDVVIFKPAVDVRYDEEEIVSHSEQRLRSTVVRDAREIEDSVGSEQVIGIDEAQFIPGDLTGAVRRLANGGRRVIVAGLDTDYRGRPFEPIDSLMCEAEVVTKLLAVCHRCGAPAHRTQRIGGGRERVIVGGQAMYEARCRRCFEPPDEEGEPRGQIRLFDE